MKFNLEGFIKDKNCYYNIDEGGEVVCYYNIIDYYNLNINYIYDVNIYGVSIKNTNFRVDRYYLDENKWVLWVKFLHKNRRLIAGNYEILIKLDIEYQYLEEYLSDEIPF